MRRFAWLFGLVAVLLTAYWTILSGFFPDRTVRLSLGKVKRELARGTLAPQQVGRVLVDPVDSLNRHQGWVEGISFAAPHANLAPVDQVLNDLNTLVSQANYISQFEESSTDYQQNLDALKLELAQYTPPSVAAWSGIGQRNLVTFGCWALWIITILLGAVRVFAPPID